jgi:uncharacterized protein YcaQ
VYDLPERVLPRAVLEAPTPDPDDARRELIARTERLFGFRYRFEIYTPAHKRDHGYYVLPFLLNGALVARVDLKAERKADKLVALATHFEPGAPVEASERLMYELRLMASWLGLSVVDSKANFGAL